MSAPDQQPAQQPAQQNVIHLPISLMQPGTPQIVEQPCYYLVKIPNGEYEAIKLYWGIMCFGNLKSDKWFLMTTHTRLCVGELY